MKNNSTHRREDCRLCGKTNLTRVVPLSPTPIGDRYNTQVECQQSQDLYPLDVFLCKECRYVGLQEIVDPTLLYGEYLYRTSISLGLPEHFQLQAYTVLNKCVSENNRVIEIGSNDGTLLRCFQAHGVQVLGIEPAKELAMRVSESGIPTISDFFSKELVSEIKKQYGLAGVIVANNVVANIDRLDDIAEGVRELLAPDGLFVFETGYLLDLLDGRILDNIYHEHLSYFSVAPLKMFFERFGLELIDVTKEDTKGGSIRCFVHHKGGPYLVSSRVKEFLSREFNQAPNLEKTFQKFQTQIQQVKTDLKEVLNERNKNEQTLAAFGASVGSTTLIYEFDIGGVLSFLVDDNPNRHDLYSPGFHLPVLSSEALYERSPDIVVILAWRYADSIIKKHQRYLEHGGKFIIPLPAIQIVEASTETEILNLANSIKLRMEQEKSSLIVGG
ncbi:MAG: class I SAM-dependent methyltransferase [Nitrospirales bacterium]